MLGLELEAGVVVVMWVVEFWLSGECVSVVSVVSV